MNVNKDSVLILNEFNCADFVAIQPQSLDANDNLIDLKKCNTMYMAKATEPKTLQVLQATVDLKCFRAT